MTAAIYSRGYVVLLRDVKTQESRGYFWAVFSLSTCSLISCSYCKNTQMLLDTKFISSNFLSVRSSKKDSSQKLTERNELTVYI